MKRKFDIQCGVHFENDEFEALKNVFSQDCLRDEKGKFDPILGWNF